MKPSWQHISKAEALYVDASPVPRLERVFDPTVDEPALRLSQRAIKRTMDLVGSVVGLLLLLPLFAVVAVAVKLDSRGPIFFRQTRMGHRGNPLVVLKFRTMVEGAEAMRAELEHLNESDGVLFKLTDDPRVTRVGRILRRFSIDELPQLWNVLRGQMSLVGPRPIDIEDYLAWEQRIAVRRRLHVRPGITGLWQVRGRRPQDTSEMVRLDLSYVTRWTALLDLTLLARTFPVVLSGRRTTDARAR